MIRRKETKAKNEGKKTGLAEEWEEKNEMKKTGAQEELKQLLL